VINNTPVKGIISDYPERLKDVLKVKEVLRRRKKFATFGKYIT